MLDFDKRAQERIEDALERCSDANVSQLTIKSVNDAKSLNVLLERFCEKVTFPLTRLKLENCKVGEVTFKNRMLDELVGLEIR